MGVAFVQARHDVERPLQPIRQQLETAQHLDRAAQGLETAALNFTKPANDRCVIVELPTELVENICEGMELPEFQCFRHTCKEMQSKSRNAFWNMHFAKVEMKLYTLGILRLVRISRQAEFAATVKEIVIKLTGRPPWKPERAAAPNVPDLEEVEKMRAEALKQDGSEQCTFEDYDDQLLLRQAIERLRCLEKIRVAPFKGLTPSEMIITDKRYNARRSIRSHAFSFVLQAVSPLDSNIKAVDASSDDGLQLEDALDFQCVTEMLLASSLGTKHALLSHLTDLRLALQYGRCGTELQDLPSTTILGQLLSTTLNLQTLHVEAARRTTNWLGTTFKSVNLPRLKELSLCSVYSEGLKSFLARHVKALEVLRLEEVGVPNEWFSDGRMRSSALVPKESKLRYLFH